MRTSVVYMKVSLFHRYFYIGSTTLDIFQREQSRLRKFRQLEKNQLAYYEPALKFWHRTNTFWQYVGIPLLHVKTDVLAVETALQKQLSPTLNWPHILPLLRKHNIQRQQYSLPTTKANVILGQTVMKRWRKLSSSIFATTIQLQRQHKTLEDKYRLLYALGSDTIQKFHVSAHLRQFTISTPFIFLLWRLSRFVSEPFRSRCQNQLRLILESRHTTIPPANIPLRLHIPDDTMLENIRNWMLGFTFFHRIHFPPLHKPRAPIIHVKNKTWGQVLYNFRRFLKWWYPDRIPSCTCAHFPEHIQQKPKTTEHIVAWASECFPHTSEFRYHTGSEVAPSWRVFHYQATEQFEKWLKKWHLPVHLQQYWQHFLNKQWHHFRRQHGPMHRRQSQLRHFLQPFIATPADHFPNSILLMCPVQYHCLLNKTFGDPSVFRPSALGAEEIMTNIESGLPEWIYKQYSWGLNFQSTLSTAYILPKPSRQFEKARPIVDYSRSWLLKLGGCLATALLEISKPVFTDLMQFTDVQAILAAVRHIFSSHSTLEDMDVVQQDIAGFYNQVSHDRIITSVEYTVLRFIDLQQCPPDQALNITVHKLERTQRLFRGRWRAHSKQHRLIPLNHLVDLTKFLLRHSIFSLGCISYRQIQGASMGSQWAPVMCSLVALHREHTYSILFGQAIFSGKLFSAFRYVDNRMLVGQKRRIDSLSQTCFWNLQFYTSPILLEDVHGFDALGFNINPHQRTITSVLPWDNVIRTTAGFGPRSAMYSGLMARTRLILENTFPRNLQLPQVQDLLAIHTSQEPAYRACIPQILSMARSFGHQWTRQQLTPFD